MKELKTLIALQLRDKVDMSWIKDKKKALRQIIISLVKFIISALGVNPETDVAYIAYTGKAAEVLRMKGCPNAMTAHKLLYNSREREENENVMVMERKPQHPTTSNSGLRNDHVKTNKIIK